MAILCGLSASGMTGGKIQWAYHLPFLYPNNSNWPPQAHEKFWHQSHGWQSEWMGWWRSRLQALKGEEDSSFFFFFFYKTIQCSLVIVMLGCLLCPAAWRTGHVGFVWPWWPKEMDPAASGCSWSTHRLYCSYSSSGRDREWLHGCQC